MDVWLKGAGTAISLRGEQGFSVWLQESKNQDALVENILSDRKYHSILKGLCNLFSSMKDAILSTEEKIVEKEKKVDIPQELTSISHSYETFRDWSQRQEVQPYVTFFPKTKLDIVRIIKWARRERKHVRCCGFRHSWTPTFVTSTSDVLISMIRPECKVEEFLSIWKSPPTEHQALHAIQFVGKKDECLVKVGAAVDNETFRKWCNAHSVTLPLNVILVENILAGTTSMCCHGSGIHNPTISDCVHAMELVDSEGRLRTFSRDKRSHRHILNAMAGSFGLFGVIVSLTMKCEPMSYAQFAPFVAPVERIIPRSDAKGSSDREFETLILDSYYNEFFLFAYQKDIFVNCWKNDGDARHVVAFPSQEVERSEKLKSFMAEFANSAMVSDVLPSNVQAHILGTLGMRTLSALSGKDPLILSLPDALHFQRGVHNFRVTDFECEIPIPPSKADTKKPDLMVVRKAWWIVSDLMDEYKKQGLSPVKLCVEMRIMGGSNIIMAPQRGNHWTCALEVLSLASTPREEWIGFCNLLIERWQLLLDEYKLGPLKPHWAKENHLLTFKKGISAAEYLRLSYRRQIEEFNAARKEAQIDLASPSMFMNSWWRNIFEFESDQLVQKQKPADQERFSIGTCCTEADVS